MGEVLMMPQRQRARQLPKNEAVAVLEEMLALSRDSEPAGLVVMMQLPSGKQHIGATGMYMQEQAAANAALAGLQDYLTWGRAYLESM